MTKSTEEIVARANYTFNGREWPTDKEGQHWPIEQAKAVLAALADAGLCVAPEEPTPAMIKKGMDIGPIGCCNMSEYDAVLCYEAMIQAGKA